MIRRAVRVGGAARPRAPSPAPRDPRTARRRRPRGRGTATVSRGATCSAGRGCTAPILRRGAFRGLVPERRLDRRVVDDHGSQRLQRGRLLAAQHERLRRLVSAGLHAPRRRVRELRPEAGRHWIIRFESVNYRATVWFNGREIGTHAGAYVPWELDLTGLRAGVNRLIVRVDNGRTAGRPAARPGRPVVELRRDPARGLPARGADRRPVAGADPDASPLPEVRRGHRRAGAGAQHDRLAAEGGADRRVRRQVAQVRVGDAGAAVVVDRARLRPDPASVAVGPRPPEAVHRDADAVGLPRPTPPGLLHIQRYSDDQGGGRTSGAERPDF